MHRNENKYDQLFRNRLRDLTHPVRNELWSRIHNSIKVPQTSVPNPGTKPSLPGLAARLNGLFSATSLTVAAAAALAITLGIIHFTHTATKPSAQPVNRYSAITPAKAPARSTGEFSVTPRDSSRDRSNEFATAKSIPANRVPYASGVPVTTVTNPNPTPENSGATVRRHHISAAPGAHGMSAAPETTSGTTETMPGTPGMEETAITTGNQAPGNQAASQLSLHPAQPHLFHHIGNPVPLPSLALTSNRAAITASTPGSKPPHHSSVTPAKPRHFQRTGYVSLYISPDFPNHNYTWSYTAGFRATLQFSPHWSFTAGLEYARVNVPTQVIPPVGYGDTLHSFYFSNYEV
jgi:hypothetical protein